MKLALNDPVWERLYGPYGVEPVTEILAELDTKWDAETAKKSILGNASSSGNPVSCHLCRTALAV